MASLVRRGEVKFIIKLLVKIAPWSFLIASIKEIGWSIAIETDKEIVEGLTIGTDDYIDRHIPEE